MAAEDAGTIESELRLKLTQMEKDALEAQKKMDALAAKLKKQGTTAGDGFAAGMKSGFDNVERSAAKLGKSLATKLSPAILAITVGIKAIQGMGKALGAAFMANEKFAKSVSDLKSSIGQGFANAVKPASDFFANLIQKAVDSAKQIKAAREELARLRGEIPAIAASEESLADRMTRLNDAAAGARAEIERLNRVIGNYRNSGAMKGDAKRKLEEQRNLLNSINSELRVLEMERGNSSETAIRAHDEYLAKLKEELAIIESKKNLNLYKDENEKIKDTVSVLDTYINKMAELKSKEQLGTGIIATLDQQIARRNELLKLLEKEPEVKEKSVKQNNKEIMFEERRKELMERYAKGLRDAESQRATNIERGMESIEAELQMKKQIEQVSAQIYADMLSIKEEYITTNQEIEKWEENLNEIKNTLGMIEPDEDKRNWLAKKFGLTEEQFGYMMNIGQSAIDAFDTISNTAIEISRRNAEEHIAIVEATLNSMLEQIEAARQAELEAKGFAKATSEEEIQKQIDRAKEAGDEVLQYKLERRKEELAINKKYDDMEKEQEDKAAREKAAIEYKLAKQEHALQIIQAANAASMAILQALSSAPPPINFVLAGLSGTAATVQIGMLMANPPKPPQFADGGIVPGRKSDGDVQHVIATAGEVILNEAQQERVAHKLEDRNGCTQITVILQVDSREMAQANADVYGSGKVLIPVRGIAH